MTGATEVAHRRKRLAGVLALTAAASLTAVSTIFVKEAYARGATPEEALVTRYVAAALILSLLALAAGRRRPWRLPRRALLISVPAGVILVLASRAELEGLTHLPAAVLIALIFTSPAWVAAIERVLLKRRVARRKIAAIVLVIGGVAVLAGPGGDLAPVGILFGLAGAIGFAGFVLVIQWTQAAGLPTFIGGAVAMGTGAVLAVAVEFDAVERLSAQPEALGYLLAAGSTIGLAFSLALIGLSRTDAVTTTAVQAFEPVLTAVLALAFLAEPLAAREVVGGCIVIVGIVFVAGADTQQPAPARPQPLLSRARP